jgi:hypothetical protein
MGRVKLPNLGAMNFSIKAVKIQGSNIIFIANLGNPPVYFGSAEMELSSDDIIGKIWPLAIWGLRSVPVSYLRAFVRRLTHHAS